MDLKNMNRDELKKKLFALFINANKIVFHKNYGLICDGISERFICAELKEALTSLVEDTIFSKYYADVEYNRGPRMLIKSYIYNNVPRRMTCDLILHSRGHDLNLDNLMCVECKKKYGSSVDTDIERLKAITKNEMGFAEGRNYVVKGYILGIFYEIDSKNKKVKIVLFYDGNIIAELAYTFAFFIDKCSRILPLLSKM